MLALGMDTSTPRVSVALVDGDGVVSRRDQLANNAHGEVLTARIDEILREAEITASELSVIGVGLGPGPFTGLRVGIVTAAAMSDGLGIPVFGQCSLDVVGSTDGGDQPFAVVSDARRRQVYWAVYNASGVRIEGPDIGLPADVAEHLRDRVRDVVGPGAAQYAGAFAGFDVADTQWPDAARLASAALVLVSSGAIAEPLVPLYLRRPDAREPAAPKRVTPA